MADETPKDERTEAPTPRRLEQAREKGDRLASKELSTAVVGAAGALWLWLQAPKFASELHQSIRGALSFDAADIVHFSPVEALSAMLWPLAWSLAVLGALVVVAAILGQGAAGGIGFTTEKLAPDFKRMDPVAGLKRVFGVRGLVELAKALLKAALLAVISYVVMKGDFPRLLSLSAMPRDAATAEAARIALKLILLLTLGLSFIGAVDIPVQLRLWLQRLRMSKQDIKEEMKQQESSPEVRNALRRMAREALKHANRGAMAEATVVITNPTHFAVALRYVPERDAAPVIVARGRGLVAQAIRELAAEHGVAVLSYPSVARALYFTGKVGMVIRSDLYAAAAVILAFVLRVGRADAAPPLAEAPDSARFDEHGRQLPPD